MVHFPEDFVGDEEQGLPEEDDNLACDFEKTDAEEASLMTWAESTTLTEKNIRKRLKEARGHLEDIGGANVKNFMRMMRWKLLNLMAEQDLDHMEPEEEELLEEFAAEQTEPANKEKPPVRTETIGEQKLAVYSTTQEEEPEDEEEKKLRKPVKAGIKTLLALDPEELQHMDKQTILALAVGKAGAKYGPEIIEKAKQYMHYITKKLAKQSIELPDRKEATEPKDLLGQLAKQSVTLSEKEGVALQYLVDHAKYDSGKADREALFTITMEDECDTFECPMCIRTLEEKLKGTEYSLDIKTTWNTNLNRVPGKWQGPRLIWVRLQKN